MINISFTINNKINNQNFNIFKFKYKNLYKYIYYINIK